MLLGKTKMPLVRAGACRGVVMPGATA